MRVLEVLIILFLTGCDVDPSYTYYSDPKSHYANEIRNKVAVRLRDEMQLYPCGTGGGCMDNIHCLALSCNYHKEVDIEEARKLLVEAGIIFLKTANENEKARPYLANFPFGLKNIELRFFLQRKGGSEFGPKKLSCIYLLDGKLTYDLMPNIYRPFITIYEETFTEAAAKLNITLTPETGLEL
jgi:hypothetical protein